MDTKITWIVKHGQQKMSSRKETRFSSQANAIAYFNEKESEGHHVDLFKEITTVTVERLT